MENRRSLLRFSAFAAAITMSLSAFALPNAADQPFMLKVSAAYDQIDPNYTTHTYGNLNYARYSDHIEICGCTSGTTSVTIPERIDGLPVTAIMRNSFQCCSLTSVTIPESVKKIGYYAFSMSDTI